MKARGQDYSGRNVSWIVRVGYQEAKEKISWLFHWILVGIPLRYKIQSTGRVYIYPPSPDKIVERTIGHKVRGSQSPYHCLSFVQVQFTISLRRIVKYNLLHGEMFFPKFNECSSTELLLYTIIYRYFV